MLFHQFHVAVGGSTIEVTCLQRIVKAITGVLLTIPFLDQVIMEMNAWFSDTQKKAVLGLSLVPAAMEKDWKGKAQELAEFYHDDADNLSVDFHCWQLKWDGHQGEKPSDPNQTLPHSSCVSSRISGSL